jgi:hypothetical protein
MINDIRAASNAWQLGLQFFLFSDGVEADRDVWCFLWGEHDI